jgi:hypothetical protein
MRYTFRTRFEKEREKKMGRNDATLFESRHVEK